MINEEHVKKFCNGDITKIENYELAVNDQTQTWHCHHRLETHNSDGEKRLVDLSMKELKKLDMYFGRPSEELIFVTFEDHNKLHHKGKTLSGKHKHILINSRKGKTNSKEHNKKISEANKNKTLSAETKRKISESKKRSKSVIRKQVICVETNEIFDSILLAAKSKNCYCSNIARVCSGKYKTAGGYHWRYA